MTNEPNFDNFLFAGERIRFCAHCTVMLVSTGRGRPPRYCSDECRREHERERERRRNVHLRPCRQCGTVFRTQHGALYCSPECKQAGNRERQRRRPVRHNPRLCAWCGATYRPTKRNARYCGRACKREHEAHCYHERQRPERERRVAERELEREARRAIADVQRLIRDECSRRACDECGTAFVPVGGTRQRYCSRRCGRRAVKRDAKHSRRQRERKSGQRVSMRRIAERDGWRCHLCGRRVRDVKAPNPLSPTLDHLVTLADGGVHEPSNVRLAHFACNSARGTGGEVQLMLVG